MPVFSHNISFGKVLNMIPGYRAFRNTRSWKKIKHKVILKTSKRKNDNYTQFLRLPTQFQALNSIIDEYFRCNEQVNICVLGCSDGSESFSISSTLLTNFPDLKFKIFSYDIDESILDKARIGRYKREQIFDNKLITKEFIENTFKINNDIFEVKNLISKHVNFEKLDVLDREKVSSLGKFDLIFSQNFLFHLKSKDVLKAFSNIVSILKENSVLFIDGIDLELREKLTIKYDLTPYGFNIEKIHNEAREARGAGWPYHYWGLEPFSKDKPDWERRYATIFFPVTLL